MFIFVISFFHQPDFSLRNFHNFQKKRQKNKVFLRLSPRRHLFQFFFRFSCIIPLGAISRVRVFIMKNDPFFNFCPFLTMSRWRHCNLTRFFDPWESLLNCQDSAIVGLRDVKNWSQWLKNIVSLAFLRKTMFLTVSPGALFLTVFQD